MTEHMWGCEVDRNLNYGELANPRCSCAFDERARLEHRITELEAIWESQAAVIRRHHSTIEEQLGFIRQQSTRIGEIAASNFGLRKSRDEATEKVAQAWDDGYSQGASPAGRLPNPHRKREPSDAGGES